MVYTFYIVSFFSTKYKLNYYLLKLVFTIGGYANRGNPIFDINKDQKEKPILSEDKKLTFTAIGYGNGPGAIKQIRTFNLTVNITSNKSRFYFKRFKKKAEYFFF